MAVRRHSTRTAGNRVADSDVLRAARDCVLDNGVRRSTLTEIARRAGVSRMTLYRRYRDVRGVVAALMTSEFAAVLDRARAEEDTGTARARLVSTLTRAIALLRDDPLLRRVLDTDPELLVPYLVQRLGSSQLTAERFVLRYLTEGHTDGSIRPGDQRAQARMLLLTAQSLVVGARPAATGTTPEALSAEFAHLLDAGLRPEEP